MLTDKHKTKRISSTLRFLTYNPQEGDEFLDYIVTGDETWVFHHTPELKQQSLQWHHMYSHTTERTSYLAKLWIGAAISNPYHSNRASFTTAKRAQPTGKGSRLTAVLSH
jgi:hypothetical protein